MTTERLLMVARGCRDYGGGYRGDAPLYEAYQDGIRTVIRALEEATRNPNDTQIQALLAMGRE